MRPKSPISFLVNEMGQGCEKGGYKKFRALKSKFAPIFGNSKVVCEKSCLL